MGIDGRSLDPSGLLLSLWRQLDPLGWPWPDLQHLDGGEVAAFALTLVDSWPLLVMLVVVWLAMAGHMGNYYGFDSLFRDDSQLRDRGFWSWRASAAFWSHFATVCLISAVWVGVHSSTARFCNPGACHAWAWAGGVPGGSLDVGVMGVALTVTLAIWLGASFFGVRAPLVEFDPPPEEKARLPARAVGGELSRGLAGGVCGIAVSLLIYVAAAAGADVLAAWRGRADIWIWSGPFLCFAAIWAAFLILAGIFGKRFIACLSILAFFLGFALAYTVARHVPQDWIPLVVLGLGGWMWWSNGLRFKLEIPGFDYSEQVEPGQRPENPRLLDPIGALDAWHVAVTGRRPGGDSSGPKPKLALLATSGGAYRAAFWTAVLLDEFERDGPSGLLESVQLVTGASGGMVAGAYFAVMRGEGSTGSVVERIENDTVAFQVSPAGGRRRVTLRRDSLTAVVHQMLLRDLPSVFLPWKQKNDRGRVLQEQWLTLDRTFAEQRRLEETGRAPVLVLSPMLVESGAPAFFSNLDLASFRSRDAGPDLENRESVEILAAFPGADKVKLATAVRLNASFPYISPAVSLPTRPAERRVVDAGYYDNFGMDFVTRYLEDSEVKAWIREHTSGVVVLQVRAFPEDPPVPGTSSLARAFQFVVSPPEAMLSARRASQIFRNNQQLRQAIASYGKIKLRNGKDDVRIEDFVRTFVFECTIRPSMSWNLSNESLEAMRWLMPGWQPPADGKPSDGRTERGIFRMFPKAARDQKGRIAETLRDLREFWNSAEA